MRRVMASAAEAGMLDKDAAPTIRDGRLVLPIAPMHKRKIQGIVHDESATGKTCYIEPAEVVEANNRTRELEIEELREIARILQEFTASIRPDIPAILRSYDTLGHLILFPPKHAWRATATPRCLISKCGKPWNGIMPFIRDCCSRCADRTRKSFRSTSV